MDLETIVCGVLMAGLSVVAAAPKDISGEIAAVIKDSEIPAMSAAVIVHGETVAAGASGIRKTGSDMKVTLSDKFHIGSCTKSMTAVLAAMMVDEGRLKWDTTVSEIFDGLAIHEGFRGATLRQLLTHTAGTPGNVEPVLWQELWKRKGTPSEQRMGLVRGILTAAPQRRAGNGFEYSNAGYAIAGAMIETVTGEAYEDLLKRKLFDPLGMKSAGFRAPARNGRIDQPYGHVKGAQGVVAVDPEPGGDNPPAIAPAGAVHCDVLDLATYAKFQLGLIGKDLISEKSREALRTPPPGSDYAMGWILADREWAGGTALTHVGSNTMFHTVIWIAPEKNFAAVAMCNYGGAKGFKKCDEMISRMIEVFLK